MRNILLLLCCLLVTFEVKSVELYLDCKFISYSHKIPENEPEFREESYLRRDIKQNYDGWLLITKDSIDGNLHNVAGRKNTVVSFKTFESSYNLAVDFLEYEKGNSLAIFLDRYTGAVSIRKHYGGFKPDEKFQTFKYKCTKREQKF